MKNIWEEVVRLSNSLPKNYLPPYECIGGTVGIQNNGEYRWNYLEEYFFFTKMNNGDLQESGFVTQVTNPDSYIKELVQNKIDAGYLPVFHPRMHKEP